MKKISLLLIAAALVGFAPALLSAQVCGPGQCMVEPGLRNNMSKMSAMMGDIDQMLKSGKLNPAQQKHMLEMMSRMSGIMQDMGSPGGPQNEAQVQEQLQQLQDKLQDLKAQISSK
jgi:hypothetical protein